MGDFRVLLEATGGHGCQREAKAGEKISGCGRMNCPDCVTVEYFDKMSKFNSISRALLIHWPNAFQWNERPVVDTFNKSTTEAHSYIDDKGKEVYYVSQQPAYRTRTIDNFKCDTNEKIEINLSTESFQELLNCLGALGSKQIVLRDSTSTRKILVNGIKDITVPDYISDKDTLTVEVV